ncbi:hypothetical protein Dsin_023277 [Dipteronia sinensis]|uniref:glycerophosphodiester phosphodiesterase n=1 Tax=Dipteronia sinensis TaxID=43782 RepID=A0AAE0A3Y1_9ROSI|nr:hypothetical protein Dsin_023277 [Dipteronia sinensis]
MCNAHALGGVVLLLLVVVVLHCNVVTLVSAQGSNTGKRWQTLSGDRPSVVARGGFSGLLPDSSFAAYNLGVMLSVPNAIAWCDVQLTKDAIGICFPDIKLQNASNIGDVYKNKDKVYLVNGVPIRGWFPIDYTFDDLAANVISEYLYFINNGDFSVDGVLSDFPITPSAAIDCFSHIGRKASKQVDLKVISKNGASGDFPSCTDLAYQHAISDGADVIDCPVQMSKDGTPFCFNSINLIDSTTASQSNYSNYAMTIPEIMKASGIFAFNLTWNEIQTLTPVISNPFTESGLLRNPKFEKAGNFLKLSDFLTQAKNSSTLYGVLISIEKKLQPVAQQQLPQHHHEMDSLDSRDAYSFHLWLRSSPLSHCFDPTTWSLSPDHYILYPYCFSHLGRNASNQAAISNPFTDYTLFRNPKFRNAGNFLKLSDFLALARNSTNLSGVLISIEPHGCWWSSVV